VLSSPLAPWKGAPLRIVFAAEKPLEGELSLIAPTEASRPNRPSATAARPISGSPRSPRRPPALGTQSLRARERRPNQHDHAGHRRARRRAAAAGRNRGAASGPLRNNWDRETENLYSAWIEKLFDAPIDATLSWKALHEVLRDRSRNFLFNHLGLREDSMGMIVRPDCADLPLLLARLFRLQDGLAVRVHEMHARRRR